MLPDDLHNVLEFLLRYRDGRQVLKLIVVFTRKPSVNVALLIFFQGHVDVECEATHLRGTVTFHQATET